MILFPAIDLKEGKCVRLVRGDMNSATVFNESPAAQAQTFAEAGCEWVHVVDLNGAILGQPVNADAVKEILATIKIPVQLGGGIRDMATIEAWMAAGVSRVVLGTAAVQNRALVLAACTRFPGRIAVGVDVRGGCVSVDGWTKASNIKAEDLVRRYEDAGVAAVVHTDIDRDGVLSGPNIAATRALAELVTIPIIVSGGVSCLDDLRAIKAAAEAGIVGVICGRALYDGRLDLDQALVQMAE